MFGRFVNSLKNKLRKFFDFESFFFQIESQTYGEKLRFKINKLFRFLIVCMQ